MSINTDLLHAEQLHAKLWGSYEPVAMAHVSPIYQTSTYVLENFDAAVYLNQHADAGFSYTRFATPTAMSWNARSPIWSTLRRLWLWPPVWVPSLPPL